MKITELAIVKSAMSAFGFSEDVTATAAKKEIKQKIESGAIKFDALSKEQAAEMIEYLEKLKQQATEQKGGLTVDEMAGNKKELGKVATIFDQIAISNYNFATAGLNADKKRVKEVAKAITELSSIYDQEIAEVEQREQAERLQFARDWFAEEIVKYDVYEFAVDWNLYKDYNLEIKGAYNYTKSGQLSSLKKDRKELITEKLNKFQTDKQVIETNEYAATLLEFYIKSDYNITSALIKLEEFKRLKIEEEERAKAKAAAEQAERERIQAQIKAEEEAKAAEEAAKLQELDTDIIESGGDLDSLWTNENDTVDQMAEVEQEKTIEDQIKDLESLIFFESMAEKQNEAKITQWRKQIAQLKVNEIERNVPTNVGQIKKFTTLTLRTFDVPATKLANLLSGVGVNVNGAAVYYEVTIENKRLDGFKKWLNENNIEIVED